MTKIETRASAKRRLTVFLILAGAWGSACTASSAAVLASVIYSNLLLFSISEQLLYSQDIHTIFVFVRYFIHEFLGHKDSESAALTL